MNQVDPIEVYGFPPAFGLASSDPATLAIKVALPT